MTTNHIAFFAANNAAAFKYSRERYGSLSNMADGFPLFIGDLQLSGPEALYQALKYPDHPEIQRAIAAARNGMEAKKAAYRRSNPPIDPIWNDVRVDAMRITLAAKLAQHPFRFAQALAETGSLVIVENSSRDDFWGAHPVPGGFRGRNVLGLLLTALRDEAAQRSAGKPAKYVDIVDVAYQFAATPATEFRLIGQPFRQYDISWTVSGMVRILSEQYSR